MNIYTVARPEIDWHQVHLFLMDNNTTWERPTTRHAGELLPELAGRLCYMSFGAQQGRKTNDAYMANILAQGHGSVLEHAQWSFIITGVSRTFTHELVRHRVGVAISQLSQRYVDSSDGADVMPEAIRTHPDPRVRASYTDHMQRSRARYGELVAALLTEAPSDLSPTDKRKWARSAARSVLPGSTETKLLWSANARTLRHVITLRGSLAAEVEIRAFAHALLAIMEVEAPNLVQDLIVKDGAVHTR